MHNPIDERVASLRATFDNLGIDAIVIPREDEYLGEYVPSHNERLRWISGFTGSAGLVVITRDSAAIFVDGRYTEQVQSQAPANMFEYRHLIEEPVSEWLLSQLEGKRLGLVSAVHSTTWYESLANTISEKIELVALSVNPIDTIWRDRPDYCPSEISQFPLQSSGQSSHDKRAAIGELLTKLGADVQVVSALDSLCWLTNLRASDVSHLPVFLGIGLLYKDGSLQLFVDSERIQGDYETHLGNQVSILAPGSIEAELKSLAGKNVLIDPNSTNAWYTHTLQTVGANVIKAQDPIALPKAQKNEIELSGMKDCHIRDGVAISEFLYWIECEVKQGNYHDEATLADKLHELRKRDPKLRNLSFGTISAAGPNAAMAHYSHTNSDVPAKLTNNSLYLVDSGGQYLDGTTDITRTVAIGVPTDAMRQQFTLVLKGHISIATAKFPIGTCGYQIDSFARMHLWQHGYDFDHGTGHGVGHYLSVHEGPQSISKRQINVPLLAGMVLSNEPAYYRAGEFGIRIENLEVVVEKETNGDLPILGFESLTRCPLDKTLIDVSLLTDDELTWVNDYHALVWSDLKDLVNGEFSTWLKQATLPITR